MNKPQVKTLFRDRENNTPGTNWEAAPMHQMIDLIYQDIQLTQPIHSAAVLKASEWTGSEAPYLYHLPILGVTAFPESDQLISLSGSATTEEVEAWTLLNLQAATQSTDQVTLKAYGFKPVIDIPVNILLHRNVD